MRRRLEDPRLDEISDERRRGILARPESAIEGSAEVERVDAEALEEGGLGAAVLVLDVVMDTAWPSEGVVRLVGEARVGAAGDGHAQVTGLDGTLAAALDQAGEARRASEPGEVAVVAERGWRWPLAIGRGGLLRWEAASRRLPSSMARTAARCSRSSLV